MHNNATFKFITADQQLQPDAADISLRSLLQPTYSNFTMCRARQRAFEPPPAPPPHPATTHPCQEKTQLAALCLGPLCCIAATTYSFTYNLPEKTPIGFFFRTHAIVAECQGSVREVISLDAGLPTAFLSRPTMSSIKVFFFLAHFTLSRPGHSLVLHPVIILRLYFKLSCPVDWIIVQ